MTDIESWIRTATDRRIRRRATLTSLLVGSILTAVNHGSELLHNGLQPGHILPIAFTYVVPFIVSLASSVSATQARAGAIGPEAPLGGALEGSSVTDVTVLPLDHGQEIWQRKTPPSR